MGVRTREAYVAALRDQRVIYYGGERVKDVTTHPALSLTVEHGATVFECAEASPASFTYEAEDGERCSAYFRIPRSPQDLLERAGLIEETTRRCRSTFNIIKAVGTDALDALHVVATRMDRALGTNYLERVRAYHRQCAGGDLTMALAQTDVKGDRSLRPHEQANPDAYLRIVERRADGIVVRGAKAHTTMAPVVDELIVLPTRALTQADREYAVAFAVRPDSFGVKMICRTIGEADRSVFDYPVSRRNVEIETLTLFEDVFVPWERVFLAGEWEWAGDLATTFAQFHRFTGISYKPPIGDLFIGCAQLVAEWNGVAQASHVREKITRLIQYTETIRACGKAAALDCQMVEGIALPNPVFTNVGKHQFASQFHEAVRLLQDLAGGLAITAPSERDYRNPEVQKALDRYLAGAGEVPAEWRLRLFHLIRDLTASDFGGYNLVVTLHGEGSLQAQLLTTYREYDLERPRALVKAILGLE
ncbi:MAG: 4-hydroxyphenylacetate 3-hydroxylase family protein [Candidatus Methylomirabilia bacterium]